MTSVAFPFLVGLPGADKRIELKEAEFRFTVPNVLALERAAGCGIAIVLARGQSLEAVVLLVTYGLKWNDKSMTEQKAIDLLEAFVDAGGDINALSDALFRGLNESGVYGRKKETPGPLDPSQTPPTSGA